MDNYSQAAAILCIDMEKKDFQTLGNNNFIPLLSVDGFINDPLFFQINNDLARVQASASEGLGTDYTFVGLMPNNKERQAQIKKAFKKVCFITSFEDLKDLSDNIVTTDYVINEMLSSSHNCRYIDNLPFEKMELILKSVEQAIERTPIESHDLYI